MEKLLDPSLSDAEFVMLLNQTIQVMYTSSSAAERNMAQTLLTQVQEMPDAWLRADKVLDEPQSSQPTKFYALQLLTGMISYRWKALPRATAETVRSYVVNKVIALSSTQEGLLSERVYLNKLNLVLVSIVKQEWPAHWRSFIQEIVGASKTNPYLCENNMVILALLSEEVFEFSHGQMKQDRIVELKNQFNDEFAMVFQLCQWVFKQADTLISTHKSLVCQSLQTLEKFLMWIPLGYIYETDLIEDLIKFFGVPYLRNASLRCMVEIGSLNVTTMYAVQIKTLLVNFMKTLVSFVPPTHDFHNVYETSDEEAQNFIMDLALFFTGFFKAHLSLLDNDENSDVQTAIRIAHEFLANLSTVPDIEVFKTCLEWWHRLASDLYSNECHPSVALLRSPLMLGGSQGIHNHILDGTNTNNNTGDGSSAMEGQARSGPSRRMFYAPILSAVRRVMISRMAKPEEVLIVEDENGEIVRETTKDTDAIALYKTMRETLVFLTHLDTDDTEHIMLERMTKQIDGTEWSWHNLNTLCWAIGSISGAMGEEEEKKFLVTVIKDLLHLCEQKRGKDNKAVVASNIMYVVGQYPRFLRAHWKFLKTVVNKNFEFMHETHPGVQDMACDTFLKIAQKCRRKFVTTQIGETRPFINEMLDNVSEIIAELEPHQIQSFYESCGCIIASHSNSQERDGLIVKLFELPNQSWQQIIYAASSSGNDVLKQRDTMKKIVNILRTNARVAGSLGPPYYVQLKFIFVDMLKMYSLYSEMISLAVQSQGVFATRTSDARNMRSVKKECLRVIEAFLSTLEHKDKDLVLRDVVDPMLEPILGNYYNSIAEARDAEVLSLFSEIVSSMKGLDDARIRMIFKSLMSCTLDMIRNNFEDFPDARLNFFKLLASINRYSFPSLFRLDENPAAAEAEFRVVVDAIVWAFRHTERNVAETGLTILLEHIQNIANSEYVGYWFQRYFRMILNEILSVLTDTLHKPGFKLQSLILMHLLGIVTSGVLKEPIWNQDNSQDNALATSNGTQPPSNPLFVRNHLMQTLSSAFPNMNEAQVLETLRGMIECNEEKAFKGHLRDFLVQTKEFSAGDNTDLYDEERQLQQIEQQKQEAERLARTPGLVAPNAMPDDGMS
ncbi:Protein EXPORTIN 1A [Porphyridium purpureum]|uniref:Exportin-1 n=1 Tax=Porphyridium purpureum TaxID=35688 RepID=A0A5J4YWB6_PORPP|nr:Protein EXPORTIN 1A [Porphyridium purpureum]|eukprot:POR3382..scf209_3